MSFERLAVASGLHYVVLGSDDLDTWEVIEEVEPGTPESVTVFDDRPVSETARRFLRVELQRDN